jgi:hypothetical protein
MLACVSGILVIILDTNVELFCIVKNNQAISISNEELFIICATIFTLLNIYLLKYTRSIRLSISKTETVFFGGILINQLVVASILFVIYGQIMTTTSYYNNLVYAIIYISLGTSIFFLLVTGIRFIHWYVRKRNYVVFLYGITMIFLLINTLVALFYLYQVSLSINDIVTDSSCRVMYGSLYNVNPDLNIALSNTYDLTSVISFVLAWLVSILMIKQYFRHKNRLVYWLLVILPLIFFLSRYEVGLYYFMSNQASEMLQAIEVASTAFEREPLQTIINSNLQLGGALFGVVFFVVALKTPSHSDLRKALIFTGIGMLFLFAAKDISALIISAYPPLGAISIGFLGIASFLVYLGTYNTAKLTTRDMKFREYLRSKIETDLALLKSISSSQNQIDIEKKVKHLVGMSSQWQVENNEQMSLEEIRKLVRDVVSETRK